MLYLLTLLHCVCCLGFYDDDYFGFSSSVRIHFKEEVEYEGIPAYRYQTSDDFLRDIGPDYGNECFCLDRIEHIPTQPNGCMHKGAMDLSTCQGKQFQRNF